MLVILLVKLLVNLQILLLAVLFYKDSFSLKERNVVTVVTVEMELVKVVHGRIPFLRGLEM